MKYRDIIGYSKPKKKSIKEISSKVKKEIINIMKYDHIDDLADYIEQFDIDKKHWGKISSYFDDIRDETMGLKDDGWADGSRKELQKLLLKVIKESKVIKPKSTKNRIIEGIKKDLHEFGIKTFKTNPPFKTEKQRLKEVGASVQHQDFLKKISKAEEEMHKYVQQYKNFLIDQDQKKLANEFSSKYVGFIGKFTHFMKTKWVKVLRKLI